MAVAIDCSDTQREKQSDSRDLTTLMYCRYCWEKAQTGPDY